MRKNYQNKAKPANLYSITIWQKPNGIYYFSYYCRCRQSHITIITIIIRLYGINYFYIKIFIQEPIRLRAMCTRGRTIVAHDVLNFSCACVNSFDEINVQRKVYHQKNWRRKNVTTKLQQQELLLETRSNKNKTYEGIQFALANVRLQTDQPKHNRFGYIFLFFLRRVLFFWFALFATVCASAYFAITHCHSRADMSNARCRFVCWKMLNNINKH